MLLISAYGILAPVYRRWRARRAMPAAPMAFGFRSESLGGGLVFNAIVLALFIYTLVISADWELGARLVPQVVGWVGAALVGARIVMDLFFTPAPAEAAAAVGGGMRAGFHFDNVTDFGDLARDEIMRRGVAYFAWCVGYLIAAALVGLLPAVLLFLIGYIRFAGRESWTMTLAVALPLWLFCYILFNTVLHISWPQAVIGNIFPALREIQSLALF